MKIALFLPLLLVVCSVCSVSTDQTEALALQQSFSPDVHAALREMVASLTKQRLQLRSLKKESAGNAAKSERQEAEIEKLKKQLEDYDTKFEGQETETNKLKQQLKVTQVAFSAALVADGHHHLGPFNTLSTLVFRHVVTNIGNAYNQHTGIFTAPVKGAYHFEWYIYGNGGHEPAGAVLMRNGARIFLAYEHQPSHVTSSSNSATLLLESGDHVFVQQWFHTKIYDNENHHITFSGHLLFTV
ncbi:complement C1q tumor necrosis factor-related protein 3-like [Odontesthes bonariensis]|uniref:complement C1q tumor necrosis factor-related protein 3-like n=1 Tax=Odontesthes bonariensis TaxID=219752 RepID=UPI003F583BAA